MKRWDKWRYALWILGWRVGWVAMLLRHAARKARLWIRWQVIFGADRIGLHGWSRHLMGSGWWAP
jgi:hypothetical protein